MVKESQILVLQTHYGKESATQIYLEVGIAMYLVRTSIKKEG